MGSSDPAADPELPPGTVVEGFTLSRPLGRGASGVVYDARRDDGVVALKVLSRAGFEDPESLARFERESRAIQRVEHPAIARVIAAGRLADGRPFLATERCDGGSLRDALRARTPLEPRRAWGILRAIGDGLAAAHRAGVVHRDVKPDNVMLTAEGDGRLVDFGLARVETPAGEAALTGAGVPLGTPAYMAPEQWWSDGVGPATDQYALAATMFELCTARTLYAGDSFVTQMQSHLSDAPPTFAAAGLTLGAAAEAWLARALARNPSDRFETMSALVAAGDVAFGVEPSRASTTAPVRVCVNPLPAAVATACAASLVAIGYAGAHSPLTWVHLAGGGGALTLVVGAGLVARAALRPTPMPLWAELSPLVLGSLGAYSGLFMVFAHASKLGPARHFEVFNLGLAEAFANRFLGLGACLAVLLTGLAQGRVPTAVTGARRDLAASCFALGALALVSLAAGAWSAAFVAALSLAALSLLGGAQGSPPLDVGRALRCGAAVLAAVALGITRADARAATAWSEAPSRAARATELLAAFGEQRATLGAAGLAVLLTVYVLARHLRRSGPPGRWGLRAPRTLVALGLCAMVLGAEVFAARTVAAHRATLWNSLSARFALYARLDPPSMGARALPLPTVGASLQMATDTLAIDGEPVGLVRALGPGGDGGNVLSVDLSHALGRSADHETLVVMADRRVAWAAVARALAAARRVGARRVELVMTRGAAPRVGAGDPPEVAYALPRDFGAVVCALTEGRSLADEGRTAADVIARLADEGRCEVSVPPDTR